MKGKDQSFSLRLASWQKRLVKDFIDLDSPFDTVLIDKGVIQCPASYKIPVEGLSRRDWILYLTDAQMKTIQKEFNLETPVSGINITESLLEKGQVKFYLRSFSLKLEAWQQRMVQDFINEKYQFEKVIIKPGVILCPASYKIPTFGLSIKDWILYLTDQQMEIIQDQFELAEAVSGINITTQQLENQEVIFQ